MVAPSTIGARSTSEFSSRVVMPSVSLQTRTSCAGVTISPTRTATVFRDCLSASYTVVMLWLYRPDQLLGQSVRVPPFAVGNGEIIVHQHGRIVDQIHINAQRVGRDALHGGTDLTLHLGAAVEAAVLRLLAKAAHDAAQLPL